MELGRLRALRELSMRKTMAAVSEALLVSPSAISQQMTLLEQEVGVPLIEKRGRGVVLTAAGRILVDRAERVFAELEAARADIEQLGNLVAGDLRVAAFPSVAAALVPQTMQRLRTDHPLLRILFEEMEPDESVAALRSWQTDVAIIDDLNVPAGILDSSMETIPLLEDVFHVMMGKDHRLAGRGAIALHDLKEEQWVMDTASATYTRMITEACKDAGFSPQIMARCRGLELSAALVKGDTGISIFPGLRASQDMKDVQVRPLQPEMRRKISLAFRKGQSHSPTLTAFVAACIEMAEDLKRGMQ
ncbi:LysR family transcriptional regulator [Paracoccus sp. SCSIO 75233]|uniref:LysR family transcriptional regulator n=1 Tax=Paracoccus sp. SCSIO 75233 TaxID=3017782 RepID=UPI0022F0A44D|nr:LysR family transcriptional regulator [Paracoccus sp. SCSIO 75233]WBU52837.1 LysR family transcriptional regulator [Paracoccus sp. SCSIO 75233]